jgi:branched-chain amino acid aminotransferase
LTVEEGARSAHTAAKNECRRLRKEGKMQSPEYIFLNGEYARYKDAKIHVLTTANKFAAIVFEGIRAYWNEEKEELFIFRHKEHIDRLFRSMKIARMDSPYSYDEYKGILIELLKKNGIREDVHIRQQSLVMTDNGHIDSTSPIGIMIAPLPLGRFLSPDKIGFRVCVSSWRRISDLDLPPRIKCSANYGNSRLASIQAKEDGYDEAIFLTSSGHVSEGTVANLFIIKDGQPLTPTITDGILEGVTRATLIQLFKEQYGLNVIERSIDRTELYTADEAFFCGSGFEISPIISVDKHRIGNGFEGPLTQKLRNTYFQVVRGNISEYYKWLTPTYENG